MKLFKLAMALIASFFAGTASATVETIDFNAFGSVSNWPGGVEDGYTMAVSSNGQLRVDVPSVGNGSIDFVAQAPSGTAPVLTITHGGAFFQFDSIDLGHFGSSPDTLIEGFVGLTLMGSDSFNPNGTMATFSALNLANLSIDRLVIHHVPDNANVVLDNIVLDTVGVPEPASLALLGLGLFGIGFSRRKKA